MITLAQDHDPDALRAAIMTQLLDHGIAEVIITFDGYADDGQIDSIGCTMLDGREGSLDFPAHIPGGMISGGATVWDPAARQYVTQPADRPATMTEVLDAWSYKLLDGIGIDWVNGDGGFGEIVITPAMNAICCDMNARFTDCHTSSHEL